MNEIEVRRGKEIYLLMVELEEVFATTKSIFQSEIAVGDQNGSKTEYLEDLVASDELLQRLMRMLSRMMPARTHFKAKRLERDMKRILKDLVSVAKDIKNFGNLTASIVKPDLDRLSVLMDEYSMV